MRRPVNPRDLKALVSILELAAVVLTPTAGATFTRDELLAQAIDLGGTECPFQRRDLEVVLSGYTKLTRKAPGGRLMLR